MIVRVVSELWQSSVILGEDVRQVRQHFMNSVQLGVRTRPALINALRQADMLGVAKFILSARRLTIRQAIQGQIQYACVHIDTTQLARALALLFLITYMHSPDLDFNRLCRFLLQSIIGKTDQSILSIFGVQLFLSIDFRIFFSVKFSSYRLKWDIYKSINFGRSLLTIMYLVKMVRN